MATVIDAVTGFWMDMVATGSIGGLALAGMMLVAAGGLVLGLVAVLLHLVAAVKDGVKQGMAAGKPEPGEV